MRTLPARSGQRGGCAGTSQHPHTEKPMVRNQKADKHVSSQHDRTNMGSTRPKRSYTHLGATCGWSAAGMHTWLVGADGRLVSRNKGR